MNNRILITGARSMLGQALAGALRTHDLVLADADAGDLRDLDYVHGIVQNVNAVVHLAPIVMCSSDGEALDLATRGTVHVLQAAAQAGASRAVVASSLALFESLPPHYAIDEGWRPRPNTSTADLSAWLAELSTREIARSTRMDAICLRFGDLVDDTGIAGQPFDPRWLHVDDAVDAIERALAIETTGWQIFHITSADPRARFPLARAKDAPFDFKPRRAFTEHADPRPRTIEQPAQVTGKPIRNVVLFGAGGPLGSAATRELESRYALRLADVRPIEALLADGKPQSPGAPTPRAPRPPHEWRVVDVRDAGQVMDACAGMDAIINCSVLRNDPHDAFLVNGLGAYNVMRAAVAHGIQRVVHTGPYMLGAHDRTGYGWDHWVVDDVPPRPGLGWLYIISKMHGQEIVRIFAEQHGLIAPTLSFAGFVDADTPIQHYLYAMSVSWADAARALRAALEAPSLPSPYEYFHIVADLPHGVFSNEKAKRLLGWQPRDTLESHYTRATPT